MGQSYFFEIFLVGRSLAEEWPAHFRRHFRPLRAAGDAAAVALAVVASSLRKLHAGSETSGRPADRGGRARHEQLASCGHALLGRCGRANICVQQRR